MLLSPKQKEFCKNMGHRWNFKGGATRSGKTYLDFKWILPIRIRERIGKDGLVVVLGVTKSTIERNVLEPMRSIYGDDLVGSISSDNTVMLFGERCYALGAESVRQVSKIRGSSIKYCYGDEVADWSEEVFELVKSRLDKAYSCFDGTFNPQGPGHWLKKFLDSDVDIFAQTYTIDDNPFLPASFVENLKREYAGTVYYGRYILGLWVAAEGAIYKQYNDNPARYTLAEPPKEITHAVIGVDFGGGKSAHAFCCVGFLRGMKGIVVLDEYREQNALTPDKLCSDFVAFVRRCQMRWLVTDAFCDSAEQTLIGGLRAAALQNGLAVNIANARKRPINDRIRALCLLMGADRFHILQSCSVTREALETAVWSSKDPTQDERLDDGTTNIDSLDAMEYAFEREIPALLDNWRE